MKLENKVIVITGAGGGVGRQLVIQALEMGAMVAAVDLNPRSLEETVRAAGNERTRLSIHVADITDNEKVLKLPDEIIRRFGGIDVLINNAGIIQPFIPIYELDDQIIRRLFEINFFGMLNMARAFIPSLADNGGGWISNVSSMGGFLPVAGQGAYGASKAAVKIATEALRQELAGVGIGVSAVFPGAIETDIKKNSGLEESRSLEEEKKSAGMSLTSPEKAAAVILKSVMKEKAKVLIGSDSKAMDFLYRLFPRQAVGMIGKVMIKNHKSAFLRPENLKILRNRKAS